MENFNGKKFYPTKETYSKTQYDPYHPNRALDDPKICTKFALTKAYKQYLHDKALEDIRTKLDTLQAKLKFQKQNYGEVDDLDLLEFNLLRDKFVQMLQS